MLLIFLCLVTKCVAQFEYEFQYIQKWYEMQRDRFSVEYDFNFALFSEKATLCLQKSSKSFLWFLSLKVTIIYAYFTLLFEDHSLPTWNDLATLLSLTPPWHSYIEEMGCDVFCGSSRLLCVLLQHQMAKLLQPNDPQRFIRGTEIWRKNLWFLEPWTLWQCFFRQCAVLKQMDSLCVLFADLNQCLREFVEKKNHSDRSKKIDWACLAED